MECTPVFSMRIDVRTIATLHRYYRNHGVNIDAVSSICRRVMELHALTVVKNGAEPFTNIAEAMNYLEAAGLDGPLRTRGQSTITKALQEEALEAEQLDQSYMKRKTINTINPDQYKAAKEALRQIQEEEESGQILGPKPGTIRGGNENG